MSEDHITEPLTKKNARFGKTRVWRLVRNHYAIRFKLGGIDAGIVKAIQARSNGEPLRTTIAAIAREIRKHLREER